ncbi:branched-chain amino acid ABC transporter permease [Clostridia bacterium]|nr:branched-chain amino acid ABC transporter permease [Clostridia bacterium]
MTKTTKSTLITIGIALAFYLVAEILLQTGSLSSLLQGLLVPLCTYVILAVSLNLTVGVLGELSLGHAGFMCVGAFAGAFFSVCTKGVITPDGLRFFLALLIGAAVAALFGILIGIPVLRLRGDYLAIVTLAFGEIIKNIINALYVGRDGRGFAFSLKDTAGLHLDSDGQLLIKGAQGITGTPHDATFTVGIVLVIVSLLIVLNLMHSRAGRAIMAIRDNRIAAESLGIGVTKYKIMAFSISAALAGAAGVLYAHNLSTLTALPKNFGYNMSILILVFVVLGGMGNMRGSMIAAIILTLLPELLRSFSERRMLIYSIVLIALMIYNWSPKVQVWKEKNRAFFRARNPFLKRVNK